jgi:hypothetical protein
VHFPNYVFIEVTFWLLCRLDEKEAKAEMEVSRGYYSILEKNCILLEQTIGY